jgi:rRNA-processing protein FCF1
VPYLLDGNNLIGVVRRAARPSEEDRAALIAEIADRLRRTRARATLFFDGPAGGRTSALGGLTVRVPRSGSADDAIVDAVSAARSPRDCVVVTADRELARRARDAGARVVAPGEFFARFGAGGNAPAERDRPPPSAGEVEEWMRYFEDEGNRGGGEDK